MGYLPKLDSEQRKELAVWVSKRGGDSVNSVLRTLMASDPSFGKIVVGPRNRKGVMRFSYQLGQLGFHQDRTVSRVIVKNKKQTRSNEEIVASYAKSAAEGDIDRMEELEAAKDGTGNFIIDSEAEKNALIEAVKADKLDAVLHLVSHSENRIVLGLSEYRSILENERKHVEEQELYELIDKQTDISEL